VRGGHEPALARLGLSEAAEAGLGAYLDLLAQWSQRVNLTGAKTPEERVERLVAPVLSALPDIPPGRLLDVGSGNGSPGLVLALVRPDLEVVLLEPRARRWAFLREATRAVGREDIDVVRSRHDDYSGPPALTLTLRALALPLGELAPLVREGGKLLVFGGSPRPSGPFVLEAERPLGEARLRIFRKGPGS
jgi:16S rRNA (guanine527-N7)-methyltransferase